MSEQKKVVVEAKEAEKLVNEAESETTVENGHIVDPKAKKESLGTKLMKPIKWVGRKIKDHPVETVIGVTATVLGVFGAKKAYEIGHDKGFADGVASVPVPEAIEAPDDEMAALTEMEDEIPNEVDGAVQEIV